MAVVPVVGGTWAWFAVCLPLVTSAEGPGFWTPVVVGLYTLLGVVWVVCSCFPSAWRGSAVRRGMWLTVPLFGLLAVMIWATNVGLAVRVRMSEADLRAFVQAPPDNLNVSISFHDSPNRVGLFTIEHAWWDGGAVFLYTGSAGLFDEGGLAYLPLGVAPPPGFRLYHLFGGWYQFVDPF